MNLNEIEISYYIIYIKKIRIIGIRMIRVILLNYSFDFGHEFLCFYDQIINIQSSLFHVYSNIHFCMKYAQAKMSDMSV